jgi:hypothetical protein
MGMGVIRFGRLKLIMIGEDAKAGNRRPPSRLLSCEERPDSTLLGHSASHSERLFLPLSGHSPKQYHNKHQGDN